MSNDKKDMNSSDLEEVSKNDKDVSSVKKQNKASAFTGIALMITVFPFAYIFSRVFLREIRGQETWFKDYLQALGRSYAVADFCDISSLCLSEWIGIIGIELIAMLFILWIQNLH